MLDRTRATEGTVSIVLPTYDGAKYIRDAVDSCLSQTYRDIELIIVDDCSSDATPRILDEIADPRMRRIRNETNQGLARSLNIGFHHSRGGYLGWTSDDNRYAPSAIEEMVAHLKANQDIAFVYADYWTIDEGGHIIQRSWLSPPEDLRRYNCVNACFLYRRSVYETIGEYDGDMALAEDYDYWLRVYRQFEMDWLPHPLYFYRAHTGSLTSREGLIKQQRAVERAKQKWLGPDPHFFPSRFARALSHKYMDLAFAHFKAGERCATRRYAVRALILDPRWLKNIGVLSILLESSVGPKATQTLRRLGHQFMPKDEGL